MRLPILTLSCACFGMASAQLTNGSFELGSGPSLEGWEWTCDEPGQPNTAAPGYGAWCATKEPGQAKGCFPSYLFQRLPDAQDGDLLTLSGWVRCGMMPPCLGASIGLGTIQNGLFNAEENVISADVAWNYISITDTVELGTGDTAVVLLSAGFIGGPISPEPAFFDGIALSPALAVGEHNISVIGHLLDRATQTLFIAGGTAAIQEVRLFDLTGRDLPTRSTRSTINSVAIDLNGLPGGIYFACVRAEGGDRTIRFTTW